MTSVNKVRISGLFLLAAFLLFMAGCGYKNRPVPPESVVPQAIADLRYTVNDKGIRLDWSYPVETIKGSSLSNIRSFELFRAEIPLDKYCGSCPIPFADPIEIEGGVTVDSEARRSGTYESSLLKSGYKYFFKIRSRSSWWASSDDSNIISFTWFEPAAAPENLTAVAGDGEITLSWNPVTMRLDGKVLEMPPDYQVLRSAGGKNFEKIGKPLSGTHYVDPQVRNGQKYFYTVQSLVVHGDEVVAGGISDDIASMPVDRTPPLPPAGVTAVWTSGGIKIFWDKSGAADIGGYRVYRRAADEDSYKLLGRVDPAYTIFVDTRAKE
ncbi:MAG: hypothetical protein JRJ68_06315, partial [Deltaproteobacteria bacterium]|nr:hypothetical protein [Deltaproteobacteria bacterium]